MRFFPYILIFILCGCDLDSHTQPLELNGYDWDKHQRFFLEHRLDEVSGIVWDKDSKTFLCIDDEFGSVYRVESLEFKIVEKIKFGKKGDYEGIVKVKGRLFVMKSTGDLFEILLSDNAVKEVNKYTFPKNNIEFESVIWSKKEQLLYLISKKSNENKKSKSTQVYSFDLKSLRYSKEPVKSISWQDVKSTDKFHVSAATLNRKNKKIYLIASIEKLLVILNNDWEVEAVHKLDKKIFKQPEGIAFDTKGNLYITNEARGGRPNIILIPKK